MGWIGLKRPCPECGGLTQHRNLDCTIGQHEHKEKMESNPQYCPAGKGECIHFRPKDSNLNLGFPVCCAPVGTNREARLPVDWFEVCPYRSKMRAPEEDVLKDCVEELARCLYAFQPRDTYSDISTILKKYWPKPQKPTADIEALADDLINACRHMAKSRPGGISVVEFKEVLERHLTHQPPEPAPQTGTLENLKWEYEARIKKLEFEKGELEKDAEHFRQLWLQKNTIPAPVNSDTVWDYLKRNCASTGLGRNVRLSVLLEALEAGRVPIQKAVNLAKMLDVLSSPSCMYESEKNRLISALKAGGVKVEGE